jgi:F-type H+-transporting ATPase subunit c
MIGITALELLVAAIQAYVFALLTSLYLNDAINLHYLTHFSYRSLHGREAAKLLGAGRPRSESAWPHSAWATCFGSFLESALRNPAAADSQQGRLFIGFAAAELLGLLAFVVR